MPGHVMSAAIAALAGAETQNEERVQQAGGVAHSAVSEGGNRMARASQEEGGTAEHSLAELPLHEALLKYRTQSSGRKA